MADRPAPTPAQRAALQAVRTGHYFYDPDSGGARHHQHRPGRTRPVYRQTLNALFDAGLVDHSPIRHGHLVLTPTGEAALR